MARDEEPLEEPFVTAGFVPAEGGETDMLDVLVLWEDVGVVVQIVSGMLEAAVEAALAEPRFGGRIRVVVPEAFVPANRANRRALDHAVARWNEAVAGRSAASGAPLVVEVRRELS